MEGKFKFWFTLSSVMQLLTGIMHCIGLIQKLIPENEKEAKLLDLMSQYQFDLGAGFYRSMEDLFNSFSICFAILFLFAAAINLFLSRQKDLKNARKGILLINLIFFFIVFVVMCRFTFLPPIICTGLIVLFLCIGYFKLEREGTME